MNRRRLLATVAGVAGSAAVSGCLSALTPAAKTETERPPGGTAGTCPAYEDVTRVVCNDEVGPAAAGAVLDPSDRAVDPDGTIEFTLENNSDRTLSTNFYDWRVDKRVDGDWYHVAPQFVAQPLMSVPPGGSHAWTVTVDDGRVESGDSVDPAGGTEDVSLRAVGGGEYAFRARGWFDGDDHEQDVAFAATFDVDADPLALTPTSTIEHTRWDGDALVARSSRGDPEGEYSRLGAYELRRVGPPVDDPHSVIVEQVVRNDQLRDALALARKRDADRVRLEEYDSTTPIFGSRSDRVYEFRESFYRVRTREVNE
ncbi:hypothetical protein BRC81_09020 [Halobacteriales archaeon QS_1_68_20]|nr:MAG: hypothetical protein BRC81_09020 [Halobacteriales archaeon QS_1_68_20]